MLGQITMTKIVTCTACLLLRQGDTTTNIHTINFIRPSITALPPYAFFPSQLDVSAMKPNLVILASHILCKNMKQFMYILKLIPNIFIVSTALK